MSHVTKYGKRVQDVKKFIDKANELGHETEILTDTDSVRMFGSNSVKAVARVKLKEWRYSLAIDKEGHIHYDHFGSPAKSMDYLGELYQEYSLSRTVDLIPFDEVENYFVETLENGDKKLVMEYAD